MGVASWLLILLGPFVGSGPVGVLLLRKGGWLLLWFLAFGGGGRVWLVAWCWHRRHACCWWAAAAVVVVVVGWLVGASCACLCACGGWHAVGVLGQCALVAWPVFCFPVCGWWGVGVGGLVVNCIVDASILL